MRAMWHLDGELHLLSSAKTALFEGPWVSIIGFISQLMALGRSTRETQVLQRGATLGPLLDAGGLWRRGREYWALFSGGRLVREFHG